MQMLRTVFRVALVQVAWMDAWYSDLDISESRHRSGVAKVLPAYPVCNDKPGSGGYEQRDEVLVMRV